MIYFKFIRIFMELIFTENLLCGRFRNLLTFFFKANKEKFSFEFNAATTYYNVVTVYMKGEVPKLANKACSKEKIR